MEPVKTARDYSGPFSQRAQASEKVLRHGVSNRDFRPDRVSVRRQQTEPYESRAVECVSGVQETVFLQRAAAQRKPGPQETPQAEMNFLSNELTGSREHDLDLFLRQVRFEHSGVRDSLMAPLGYRIFLCPRCPTEDASWWKPDVTLEDPRDGVLYILKDEGMDPARGFAIGRERCLCLSDQSCQREPDSKESDAAGLCVSLPELQQRQIDRRRRGSIDRVLHCVITVHSSENAN